jgi:hypothetical protein
MKKFQTKLAFQQAKLAQHIRNLSNFALGSRFQCVAPEEQDLIIEQIKAMSALNAIFIARLEIHGITPECYEENK